MTEPTSALHKAYLLPIRRPVTTVMLFMTLLVFGWKSYQELPINLMPDISYPTLTVRSEFEGAAPEDVEKLLTRPLEETLSIVSGMVEISSVSSPGLSEIVMEFNWGTDMNAAQQEVRDRLDLFQPPREVTQKPVILRYDPTLDPVMRVAITGPDRSGVVDPAERARLELNDLTAVREAVERHIKSDLEAQSGIAQIEAKGGREEEIEIQVDADRLKSLGLSLSNVVTALSQQNINLSGGRLKEGKTEYLVRTLNEFDDLEEIKQTVVGVTGGRTLNGLGDLSAAAALSGQKDTSRPVRLSEVANVTRGQKDRDTVVRINGREAVEIDVYKEGDANIVAVCNLLKDAFNFPRERTFIEKVSRRVQTAMQTARNGGKPKEDSQALLTELAQTIRARLDKDAQVVMISDQSRFINASIKEVKDAAVDGGILALAILYFFLRDLRSTALIGVSIPISIVASFIPMFAMGISLNIMSLGGLALGVGRMVDDSIVVLESIFRCREEGDGAVDAADRGTREVAAAVISSTLTTVAVFFPIAFIEGVAGQLFRDQALTVTFSLLASLLAAMFLVPMVASRQVGEFTKTQHAVWMLRAYREQRDKNGRSRGRALLGVIPAAPRYFLNAVREAWTLNMRPVLRAVGRATTTEERAPGVWARVFAFIASPILLVLFAMHVGLLLGGGILGSLAFVAALVGVAAAVLSYKFLKIVFWIPLTLFEKSFNAFRDAYAVGLRRLMPYGPVILLLGVLLAAHSASRVPHLGQELIPPMKQGEFSIRLDAPPGTRLEETERRAQLIEKRIAELSDVVETCAVQVGLSGRKASGSRGENVAEFNIILRDPSKNVLRQDEIIETLRERISADTTDKITFSLPALFSFKTAVELQLRGDDGEVLAKVGQRALDVVKQVSGVKDAELNIRKGYPEIIIVLDRDKLASHGIQPEQVAQRLRTEVQGDVATRFSDSGNKIDMRVRSERKRMQSLLDLESLSVTDGHPPLPLSAVARIERKEGPSEVRRVDQRQVAVVTANVEGRDLGAVSRDIEARVASIEKPDDYFFVLGGQNRELQVSYQSLKFALLLAMFLVYVVMACQFESLIHPALIMFSIPLAFIGVVYSLEALHVRLSIMVFIGGIMLAGIVVNNAIVLIDYVNRLRHRGMSKVDALVLAGKVRLRPILMTTLTTVLGLIPMAMTKGEGAEVRSPLAITVIAGLTSSTLLTLVFIPIVYNLFGGRDKK